MKQMTCDRVHYCPYFFQEEKKRVRILGGMIMTDRLHAAFAGQCRVRVSYVCDNASGRARC